MSDIITPKLAKQLKGATPEVKLRAAELLNQIEQAKKVETAQNTFMGFVDYMWPAFINGRHHKIMAKAFTCMVSRAVSQQKNYSDGTHR